MKCTAQHASKKEEAVRHNTLSGPPINIGPNAVKIYLLASIPYVSRVQPRDAPNEEGASIRWLRRGCVALSAPWTWRIRLSLGIFFKKARTAGPDRGKRKRERGKTGGKTLLTFEPPAVSCEGYVFGRRGRFR